MQRPIKKTKKENKHLLFVSIIIITIAIFMSSVNKESITTGKVVSAECPPDKTTLKQSTDSPGTTGPWDYKYMGMDDAMNACRDKANNERVEDCEEYCRPCRGDLEVLDLKVIGFWSNVGGNIDIDMFPMPSSRRIELAASGKVAAICEIRSTCRCSGGGKQKSKQQYIEGEPLNNQQQQIQQSQQGGLFARWLRAFFGLFIFAGPIPKKKGE